MCLLDLAFFGLSLDNAPVIRADLFLQIHDICFWGQGGYNFETVYNLPIWLRKFILNQLKKHYDKENNSDDANMQTTLQNLKQFQNQKQEIQQRLNKKLLYKPGTSKK